MNVVAKVIKITDVHANKDVITLFSNGTEVGEIDFEVHKILIISNLLDTWGFVLIDAEDNSLAISSASYEAVTNGAYTTKRKKRG